MMSHIPPGLQEFYSTFAASIRSVGTAVTLAAVGVYLHRRQFVSSEGKRTLARISQQVTFPLFLFSKICYCNQDWSSEPCPDVTKSLRDVWILLLWPAVVVGIGFLVGWAAAIVAGTPKSQHRSVLAACGFGNSTGLPITLLTVVHANFPATSDLGRMDPTLFLSVYLLLYPVLQWGVGGWLLAPEEEEATNDNGTSAALSSYQNMEEAPGGGITESQHKKRPSANYGRNVLNNKQKESFYKLSRNAIGETDASLYISDADLVQHFRNGGVEEPESNEYYSARLTNDDVVNDNNDPEQEDSYNHSYETYETPLVVHDNDDPTATETTGLLPQSNNTQAVENNTEPSYEYREETLCDTCNKILSRCFQPPVVGALAGIFVAATPLRGIFVDLVDRSSSAPLEWFFDGLYAVGQAAVPINMIILGCNLSASYQTTGNKPKKSDSAAVAAVTTETVVPLPSSNLLSQKTMFAIVVGKMIVMPIMGILLAVFLQAFVLDIPTDIDGSFYLVLMIVFITPTANNVMVMVELSGSNTKEGIAQVIALQYACAPLLLSFTMSLVVGIASKWGAENDYVPTTMPS